MGTTLTIRNLDDDVKQKLRLQAAKHQRSMEAEARKIIAASVNEEPPAPKNSDTEIADRRKRIEAVIGIWENEMEKRTTDDIMQELRGDD